MFERYTEKARRVIFFARYEASQFGTPAIEPEHVLLGLLREDRGLVSRFGPDLRAERARKEIEKRVTKGPKTSTSVDLPLSPECKRILACAQEESERLRHRYIGTEHLLLGLLREEKSLAAEILSEHGVRLDHVREEVGQGGWSSVGATAESAGTGTIGAAAGGIRDFWTWMRTARLRSFVARVLYDTTFGHYTKGARRALLFARVEAGIFGAQRVEPEHVLLGVLNAHDGELAYRMPALFEELSAIRTKILRWQDERRAVPMTERIPFAPATLRVLAAAQEEAAASGVDRVGPGHLLLGLLADDTSQTSALLTARGATREAIRRALGDDAP